MKTKAILISLGLAVCLGLSAKAAEPTSYAKQLSAAYRAVGLPHKATRAKRGYLDAPEKPSHQLVTSVRPNWQDKDFAQGLPHKAGETLLRHSSVTYETDGVLVAAENYELMKQTHIQLVAALARGGRHSHSGKAAAAQAQFECWAMKNDPNCKEQALVLVQGLAQVSHNQPYYVETKDSDPGISCKDAPRERRHSFGGYHRLSDEIAEALDRARMEAAAGIACLETSR